MNTISVAYRGYAAKRTSVFAIVKTKETNVIIRADPVYIQSIMVFNSGKYIPELVFKGSANNSQCCCLSCVQ